MDRCETHGGIVAGFKDTLFCGGEADNQSCVVGGVRQRALKDTVATWMLEYRERHKEDTPQTAVSTWADTYRGEWDTDIRRGGDKNTLGELRRWRDAR